MELCDLALLACHKICRLPRRILPKFRLEADDLNEVAKPFSARDQRLSRPPAVISVLPLAGEIIADFVKIHPAVQITTRR
jgi:hypothetical protein